MCWCSWHSTDVPWLQWISSKNYSISSAALALDGITAGKSFRQPLTSALNGRQPFCTALCYQQFGVVCPNAAACPMLALQHASIKLGRSFRAIITCIKILMRICEDRLISLLSAKFNLGTLWKISVLQGTQNKQRLEDKVPLDTHCSLWAESTTENSESTVQLSKTTIVTKMKRY